MNEFKPLQLKLYKLAQDNIEDKVILNLLLYKINETILMSTKMLKKLDEYGYDMRENEWIDREDTYNWIKNINVNNIHLPRAISNRRTICEVHREILDIIYEYVKDTDVKEQMLKLIVELYHLGKDVDNALKREYNYSITNRHWMGPDRINPYIKLVKFYRKMRKIGNKVEDPYKLEAEEFKNNIKRDIKNKDEFVEVEEFYGNKDE